MSARAGWRVSIQPVLIEIDGPVKLRNCSLQDMAGHTTGDGH